MENLVMPLTSDHDVLINDRNARFNVKVPEDASKDAIELIEAKK